MGCTQQVGSKVFANSIGRRGHDEVILKPNDGQLIATASANDKRRARRTNTCCSLRLTVIEPADSTRSRAAALVEDPLDATVANCRGLKTEGSSKAIAALKIQI